MQLQEHIWSWRYRDCYSTNNENICGKKVKPTLKKNFFWKSINIKTSLFTLFNFWIRDFNKFEYSNFQKIPETLSAYVPEHVSLEWDVLYSSRPRDYDWSYSKNIQELWVIHDDTFWEHIHFITDELLKHKLRFTDIFHLWNNLIVQKVSPNQYKPILVDVKRLGARMYPLQPLLYLPGQMKKKFLRRLQKFKWKFHAVEAA